MADRRLQVFATVARLLSFTKAAEALHMTQPAVTFQVRQLEEEFNTRLFDRARNKVTLTAAGELVYLYAERIFDLYTDMGQAVRELTGEIGGAVTLGASTTIAEYMLPTLLGAFKNHYPEVNLRLKVSNSEGVVAMVENNAIDLGVVESFIGNRQLVVEVCLIDQLVAVVPPGHALAGNAAVNAAILTQYPFICREEGSGTREVVLEHMRSQGVDIQRLNVCVELGSSESIKGAIQAGLGVSVLSRAAISKELRLGLLVEVPLDPPLERPFSFVRQRQKFRAWATEELLAFARDYCKTVPA